MTDFDDACRALDELPADVVQVNRLIHGDDWVSRRCKPLPTDRALTGEAMDWVISLPVQLRPHCACEEFPRVVNATAASWGDLHYSLQVIEHVTNDNRGGRLTHRRPDGTAGVVRAPEQTRWRVRPSSRGFSPRL